MALQSRSLMEDEEVTTASFVVPLSKPQSALPIPRDLEEPETKPIYRHGYSKSTIVMLLSTSVNILYLSGPSNGLPIDFTNDEWTGMDKQNSHSMDIFSARVDKYEPRRDNLPRVLLRGWHPGTAAAGLGLNTARGIYPFAWQCLLPASNARVNREPPSLPSRLTELSGPAVAALAQSHIAGDELPIGGPFTSWTGDWPTAVFFALGSYGQFEWEMSEATGYIAVVDSSEPLPVIHVPDLGWQNLPQEYLVYGPVTQGVRVVSVAEIRKALNCERWPFCHSVRREPHSVTEEEIRDSVRVGLLFQGPEDKHVDVAMVIAASLLSWAQVRVLSPRPLSETDLLRAQTEQTRPWPQADVDTILGSRLLVHAGAGPPLSGAILGNPLTNTLGAPQLELTIHLLTNMQSAWAPATHTAGTSPSTLTRVQWAAAFEVAANKYLHDCGPIWCDFCKKTQTSATAADWPKFESTNFCSEQCQDSHARIGKVDRGSQFQ